MIIKIVLEHIANNTNVTKEQFKQIVTQQIQKEIYLLQLKKAVIKKFFEVDNLKLVNS